MHVPGYAVASVVVLLAPCRAARPQVADRAPGPPSATREVTETIGAAINPPGLQNELTVAWSRRITGSQRPVLEDAHLAFGLTHLLSPSYTRLGAWMEYSPLSILDVRAGVEPSLYFATFGTLAPFEAYGADYSWDAVSVMKGHAAAGVRAFLRPTFKMEAGPVVGFVRGELEWWRTSAGGPLVYEPWRDTLIRANGATLVSESAALLLQRKVKDGSWSGGLAQDLLRNLDTPDTRIHRLGVVALREFSGRRFGLRAPTIVVSATWYLDDPSKKGTVYALVGVSFTLARTERR